MHGVKTNILFLKEEHKYTNLNIGFEEAVIKHPDSIRTLKPGTILYSQDHSFTIEQVAEVKQKGFSYQWGFGPCAENIPFSKLQFARVEPFYV